MTRLPRRALLAGAALSLAGRADAQPAWPARPVRAVISFPPGGAIDTVMRLVGPAMAETLGQPVVLENRPGAAGSIAAAAVAAAAPDGYTLLCDSSAHATAPHLIANLPFRYEQAFTAVTQLSSMPMLLVTNPSLPATTIAEFLALGSAPHYALVLFQQLSGIEITHVPFRGGGPAVQALLAGTVDFHIATAAAAAALVQEGRLRGLAVGSAARAPQFPTLPTLQEAGLAGYEYLEWGAILAPAGTPAPIVARIQSAAAEALRQPAIRERLERISIEPVGSTPTDAAVFIAAQRELGGRLTRAASVTLD